MNFSRGPNRELKQWHFWAKLVTGGEVQKFVLLTSFLLRNTRFSCISLLSIIESPIIHYIYPGSSPPPSKVIVSVCSWGVCSSPRSIWKQQLMQDFRGGGVFYMAVNLQHSSFVFSLATRERPYKFIFLSPSKAFRWSSKSESYFILCV